MAGRGALARLLRLAAASGLALQPAFGVLRPEGDASALLQSAVHSHSGHGRRKASTGLGGLLDAGMAAVAQRVRQVAAQPAVAAAQPDIVAKMTELVAAKFAERQRAKPTVRQHVAMSRYSDDAESGAFIDLRASRADCENVCEFTWGDNVSLMSAAHMPSSFKARDKVSISLDCAFDVAETQSVLSAAFVGQIYSWWGSCELCGGSCTMSTASDTDDSFFELSFPSLLTDKKRYCHDGQTDMILFDRYYKLPLVDAAMLKMSGQLNATIALLRDDKTVASSLIVLDFEPTPAAAAPGDEVALAEAATPAPAEEAAPVAEAAPLEPQTLPGLLQLSFGQLLGSGRAAWQAKEEARSLAQKDKGFPRLVKDTVNAAIYDLQIFEMEKSDGTNLTLSADFCKKVGENGGYKCHLPFGEKDSVSLGAHLSTDLTEGGGYMLLSVTPKVTGKIGEMIKKYLEEFTVREIEIPLCTQDPDDNVFPLTIFKTIQGLYLPPCGKFELNFQTPSMDISIPQRLELPLEEIMGNNPLSILGMSDLNHLPPAWLDFHLQLLHQGAVPIADLKFKVGLAKVD